MLLSFALALLLGLLLSSFFKKFHLPPLLGMIFAGIAIGPHALNWLDERFLAISSDLREVALIIILTRAGLTLHINELKQVGRPAFLMCFIPAIFEIAAMVFFAPRWLHVSISEALLLGCVVAAVSPAVIVPKMINIIEEGYGVKKSIPQMILASASVDDVFVIILFTSALSLVQGSVVSPVSMLDIPLSIGFGIGIGFLCAFVLAKIFKGMRLRDSQKVLIVLSVGFLLVSFEDLMNSTIPFSALIAVMMMGITLKANVPVVSSRLSIKFSKLWVFAEIMLFVLVGASVNLSFAFQEGFIAIVVVFAVITFRLIGVWLCLIKTNLLYKERVFCMFAYIPKATVQAAIGGIPLALGLSCGNIVVTIAVISILISAPLGSILIERSYKKLL